MTKDDIRHKVYVRLAQAGEIRFPHGLARVPNFSGADRATALLCELPMWKRARVVKVSCDAPLLAVRRVALAEHKLLYLAVPGLRGDRCFVELDAAKLGPRALQAASIPGALRFGRLVGPQDMRPVDAIVCGSVAVTRQGARVGRGGGYDDLEYGLLRTEGKVREYTPILTTVHPLQLVEERIPMRGHDIPVDFVITPEHVLAAPSVHPRPRGVIWDILPESKILAIPLLRRSRRYARSSPSPRLI
jgi:5-formyltetrahydrofolate cyclo-ligase